jgi:hypothetical protein
MELIGSFQPASLFEDAFSVAVVFDLVDPLWSLGWLSRDLSGTTQTFSDEEALGA